jgi:DNA polymerase-3 subunit gamma/tau
MRAMTRMWQMLLKALEEVSFAPNAMMAAEMAVIRLTHVADLPAPEDLLRKLHDTPPPPGGSAPSPSPALQSAPQASAKPRSPSSGGAATALAVDTEHALARFATFPQVVELIRHKRDVKLLVEVETNLRLARYSPGRIEFVPTDNAPHDLAQRLGARLQSWTGVRWAVTVVNTGGAKTIAEVRDADRLVAEAKAREHPLVQAVFEAFPGAKITGIRSPEQLQAGAEVAYLPEVEDEWDPFEDA